MEKQEMTDKEFYTASLKGFRIAAVVSALVVAGSVAHSIVRGEQSTADEIELATGALAFVGSVLMCDTLKEEGF